PAERLQLIQSYLTELVARVLGQSVSKLDVQQPLSNLGLDSLMAVELKNRIAVDLGVDVPMVKFLQDFSVAQAATQVLEQLAAEASNSAMTDRDSVPDISQLSDAEVDSLL